MVKPFYLIVTGLFLLGLVVLELSFGNWISGSRINMVQVLKNVHQELEVKFPGAHSSEKVLYVRDRWGLRGTYPTASEIDFLTMGASTTDQRYITEGKTWQDVMARCLSERKKRPVYVVNAGVDGSSLYGHLQSFDLWFPEIPNLKPKYVLIYTGIIDYGALEQVGMKPHLPVKARFGFLDVLTKKSALYQIYQVYRARKENPARFVQHGERAPMQKEKRSLIDVEKDKSLEKEFVREDIIENYKTRLQEVNKAIRGIGAVPIFVSQRSMHYVFEGKDILSLDGRKGFGYYKRWNRMAEAAKEVCKKTESICINLQKELTLDLEDFYDEGHNTVKGVSKIGNYLCEKVSGLNF